MLRVPFAPIVRGELSLDPEASRYVARVHRVRVGDRVLLFDPENAIESEAEVLAVDHRSVRCRVDDVRPGRIVATRRVTLVQGLAKGDKIDAIVRDATELGATGLVIAQMARSTVRVAVADAGVRRERWHRIAVEAARQSGRSDLPDILGPVSWDEALSACSSTRTQSSSSATATATATATTTVTAARRTAPPALRICLWEQATEPLGPMLAAAPIGADVFIIVGPEGGLEADEVARAAAAGFAVASLGPVVLRTETVAAAVLGALLIIEQTRSPAT